MSDKKIIEQLNRLKTVTPDSSWKEENRRILFSQISNSYADSYQPSVKERIEKAKDSLVSFISSFAKSLSKPVWAVVIATLLIGAGGVAAQPAYNSRPGDSLYFAKKLTQKIRLALVFDKKEKARMNIRFSSNHAKDITEVLSDSQFSDKRMAQELQVNFREELDSLKADLRSMTGKATSSDNGVANKADSDRDVAVAPDENEDTGQDRGDRGDAGTNDSPEKEAGETADNSQGSEEDVDNSEENSDNNGFSIADFEKNGEGKDIYIPEDKNDNSGEEEDGATAEVQKEITDAGQKLKNKEDSVDESALSELYDILNRAEAEFEQERYEQARQLLDEFGKKLDSIEEGSEGEVKGVSEEATSTPEETASSTATSSPEDN
jgi:hypothetical protein